MVMFAFGFVSGGLGAVILLHLYGRKLDMDQRKQRIISDILKRNNQVVN
jgi:positive regulator of sigma E activity